MNRVLALVEGQTELAFVNALLAEPLSHLGVYLSATMVGKPGQKGGIRRYEGIKRDLLAALRQDKNRYCTTMFDYYGLPLDWPGRSTISAGSPSRTAERIENAVLEDISVSMGSSFFPASFIPYIQMHEFEALLFAEPATLAETVGQSNLAERFLAIVRECGDPESINDDAETAPSKRIQRIAPRYQKPDLAVLTAKRIGLAKIRERCPHFNDWLKRLETLSRPIS